MTRTILVVEDNEFNRDGVVLYLKSHGYRTVEAGDEAEALAIAGREQPWAAVVDIVIPTQAGSKASTSQSVGLRLARRLKELHPSLGLVIFSAHEDRGAEVWSLVRDGVRGIAYLLKGARPEELLEAIQNTVTGRVILDGVPPTARSRLAEEMLVRLSPQERPWVERAVILMPSLSEREREVGRRLAASQNTQGIADDLNITPKTVEGHISHVYDRLGLAGVDQRSPTLRKAVLLAKAFMIYELLSG